MTLFEQLVRTPGGIAWLESLSPRDASILLRSVEFMGAEAVIAQLRDELVDARREIRLLRSLLPRRRHKR